MLRAFFNFLSSSANPSSQVQVMICILAPAGANPAGAFSLPKITVYMRVSALKLEL